MIQKIFAALSSLFFLLGTQAQGADLVFATENQNSFPWIMVDGGGANTHLLETAAANLGHTLTIKRVPWKRCLRSIEADMIDGCYAASFKKDRTAFGVYPSKYGYPDTSKRLHSNSYSLYIREGATLDWDGERFLNLTGNIAAPTGFSIIDKLKKNKVNVVEAASTEAAFRMLCAARVDGVAALTPEAERILASADFAGEPIVRVEVPLVVKPYYLMFSHHRMNTTPELVLEFYDEIERVRKSDAYQSFLKNIQGSM